MDKSKMTTQNDWEDEIKDMLCDAGLKTIHFKLNNSGVRIINRIKKELADARREVVRRIEAMPNTDVRPEITVWLEPKEYCLGYNKALNDVLATIKKLDNNLSAGGQ